MGGGGGGRGGGGEGGHGGYRMLRVPGESWGVGVQRAMPEGCCGEQAGRRGWGTSDECSGRSLRLFKGAGPPSWGMIGSATRGTRGTAGGTGAAS